MDTITIEKTIEDYVEGLHDEELVLMRLRNAATSQAVQTGFNADELRWLEAHFDKLPVILRSKMACSIYTAVSRMSGGGYLRQLCRALSSSAKRPVSNSTVDWWLKKFFLTDLFHRRAQARGWGREILYYVPKKYPNLDRFLRNLMAKRLGTHLDVGQQ